MIGIGEHDLEVAHRLPLVIIVGGPDLQAELQFSDRDQQVALGPRGHPHRRRELGKKCEQFLVQTVLAPVSLEELQFAQ